jgi:hypothetical protein
MTPFETVVAGRLIEQGYEVYTSGWPDFCCVKKDGDRQIVVFVEVKSATDGIRDNQKKIHAVFQSLGIEVKVIHENPDVRMSPLMENMDAPKMGRPDTKLQTAIQWLEAALQDGEPVRTQLLRENAKGELNISSQTLDRAFSALKVKSRKVAGHWCWVSSHAMESAEEAI